MAQYVVNHEKNNQWRFNNRLKGFKSQIKPYP